MIQRCAPFLLLLTSGCSGSLDVFPELKGTEDSGAQTFDPNNPVDTGLSGTGNGGSGSGGSGGSGGNGNTSGGSGSGGDSAGGSGSGGDSSSGSDTSGGSGSSGDTSGGSGSGGDSSGGSGSSGSGSSGSGSSGSGSSGSGSGGVTAGVGTYVIEQAIGELSPYYYPCEYVFDVYFSSSTAHCPGCDFVLDGTFSFNNASSHSGASYCAVTDRNFTATLAHDSDYLGSMSTSMYYYYGLWYPLDYTASYTSGSWRMDWGFRDYPVLFYYYTDYRTVTAALY